MSTFSVQVPLRITVEIDSVAALTAPPKAVAEAAVAGAGLERVSIDPNYANRRGYDPAFLGLRVELPVLTEEQRQNAAKNVRSADGEDATVLSYHHFSIVMNRRRQLAYYTAVNIDGKLARQPVRSGDRWSYDPRIAESEQIGADLYARNELDRGHLVRRLDPAWGKEEEALRANDDTFHFTNCSPQHAGFNQSDETWQGIENYLLGKATAKRSRLTIFTGPVMAENDPLYRGVRLPRHFWKIAAYSDDGATLSVSAYLLSQAGLIDGLERFASETFQVPVEEIMERTGLDFSPLVGPQANLEHGAGFEKAARRVQLRQLADIVIR